MKFSLKNIKYTVEKIQPFSKDVTEIILKSVNGGIGITLFMSMVESLSSDFSQHIDLYYSLKNERESMFIDKLQNLSRSNPQFKFTYIFSDQVGHLTAEAIMNKTEDITSKEIFICGPKSMMKSLKEQFIKKGVGSE